jgi:adenylate cyclase
VGHLGSVTYQVLVEERERRWIKRAFQQYVPAEVVDEVAQHPEALAFGGERRAMTVLFSDIRGYTTFSERHPPEEVVAVLHEYLTEMVDAVFRNKGTLDKFIGDSVMALFGAPLADPEHALNACRAAIEMCEALERLNARWATGGRESLEAGIGIASGEMVVGNLGSTQRFAYTVMGDQVNLAARLEGLNKEYPTSRHIIISDGVYAQVRDRVAAHPLGSVKVKGRLQSVEIYELVDVTPATGEGAS